MIAGLALQPGSNGGEHAVGFVHHIPGREAQHGEAASAEIVVAGRVVALCTIALVAEAVDLDDEAGMKTREIDDVAADPDLLADVVAIGAQAIELAPEADFGGAGFSHVIFKGCNLARADFAGCRMFDVDLRGSDLSSVKGVTGLKGAKIDMTQLISLSQLLASELGILVEE